jgi:hypothetical protein
MEVTGQLHPPAALPSGYPLGGPQSLSERCGEETNLLTRKRRIQKSMKKLRRKMTRGRKRMTTRKGDDKEEGKKYKIKGEEDKEVIRDK